MFLVMFNKNIYLFFGAGELGNQIFQYAFLCSNVPVNSKIISSNLCELEDLMIINKHLNFVHIRNRIFKFICRKFFNKILILLSRIKIISSIDIELLNYKNYKYEGTKIIKTNGFLPVTFIFPRYFQNEFFFNEKIINSFQFKKKHIENCNNFLSKIPKDYNPVFVHVRSCRRKNELKFKIFDKVGIDLPDEYFYTGIDWFQKNLKSPFFIIISDNINFAKDKFSHLKNKVFSNNDINTDLLLISKCNNGIMSNSSISWWGAYMIKNKKKIFAPKYWMGWKSKITVQDNAVPSFAEKLDPNNFL